MKKVVLILSYCFILNLSFAATVSWDDGGDGVSWSDANNWDTGVVPTAADDVIIDGFTVVLDITTTVQRVYLLGSSDLTINATFTLNIDGYTENDEGFEVNNSATVTNNGTVNVLNIEGGSGADGIYVRGTFINNGTISIDGIGQHGLYVQRGNFTNNMVGIITITDTGTINGDGDGLYVDDSGGVLGLLTNHGSLTITTTTGDDGIYVNDGTTLNNHGTLTISGGDNGIRVDDMGTFNNESGGIINIDGGSDDQLYTHNAGSVFNNSGTINLTNADSDDAGLYVITNGIFNNLIGGVINVDGALQYAVQIDANSGSAEISNSGTINVTSSANDGIRIQENGTFTNNATGIINMITVGDEGVQVDNPGLFNNLGTLDIDTPSDHGMELLGTFENSGSIAIDDPADNGIYITNAGIFNNNVGGTITTTNVEDHSIQIDANSNATPATFTNSGSITLTGSIDHALRSQENGVYTNNAGGVLNIVDALKKGILIESGAVINNSGTIDITAATQEGMDLIEGTFNNMVGGIYKAIDTVDDGLEINGPSVMNNDGLLDINGSGSEDIEVLYGPNFELPVINNSSTATFAPGSSPGFFEIRGDFDLGASTITFEINGTTANDPSTGMAGDFDQIFNTTSSNFMMLSTSKAHLDWGTFVPVVGDKFKIVDGSGLTLGSFSEVTSSLPQLEYTTTNLGTEIEVEITAILPVELAQFTIEKVERGAQLNWQTATEIDNESFDIERSTNGYDWKKIGQELGRGNSYRLEDYSFLDLSPEAGTNYYRLKQNDIDGNYEYSNILSLDFASNISVIEVYPIPVQNVLQIAMSKEIENVKMQLHDSTGKVIWSSKELVTRIPFETINSGIYFLEISTMTDRITHKIIK